MATQSARQKDKAWINDEERSVREAATSAIERVKTPLLVNIKVLGKKEGVDKFGSSLPFTLVGSVNKLDEHYEYAQERLSKLRSDFLGVLRGGLKWFSEFSFEHQISERKLYEVKSALEKCIDDHTMLLLERLDASLNGFKETRKYEKLFFLLDDLEADSNRLIESFSAKLTVLRFQANSLRTEPNTEIPR